MTDIMDELKMTPAVLQLANAIAYHNQKVRELDLAKSEVVRLMREMLGKGKVKGD